MAKPNPVRSTTAGSAGWENLKPAALVVVATVLAYLPSFRGDFIWNDSDYVTAPALRSLAGLGAIWTKLGATEQYYPLLHSFFWIQDKVWGDHPFGYHLVTLVLHLTAAVLFALALRRLFDLESSVSAAPTKESGSKPLPTAAQSKRYPGAEWIAALIFALHPVHVESVAWITEQKNTLSLVFYLMAAWLYLRFDATRQTRTYVIAFVWFFLSLLCKTVTASLPAALLVVLWWKRGRLEWRRDFRLLLPWLATGAAVGLFTSWVEQNYLGAKGQDFTLPFLERGLVAGRAIWFYLGNLVWPFDLNFLYPRWVPDRTVGWQWLFPAAALGLLAGCWALRRRNRAPLAALLFFVGSLFPVLGFVNLYGALYSFVWDHWQYLPDLGPIALAAVGLSLGWERFRFGPRLVGAALLALFLGTLTWLHCGMFRDDLTLYRETLARNPTAWMAHYNLGNLLLKNPGRELEAISHYEAVLRLKPDHAGAHTNYGNTLLKMPGREAEAMGHYEAALRINPADAEAEYNLATVLSKAPGREAEAIGHYEAALRITPEVAEIHYNLGNLLLKAKDRLPDAILHYRAAVRINPGLAEAHYNLGIALLSDRERIPEAITHLEAALRIRPDFPLARQIVDRWYAALRRP